MDKLREFAEERWLRHWQQLTTFHDNLRMLRRLASRNRSKNICGNARPPWAFPRYL
jgi:hypothetical protein